MPAPGPARWTARRQADQGRLGKDNPVTGHEEFPRIDPAVICLVHDGGDRAVLGRRRCGRADVLAAGRVVEAGESSETCVVRGNLKRSGCRSAMGAISEPAVAVSALADGRLPCDRRSRPGLLVQRRGDRRGGLVHPRRGARRAGPRRLESAEDGKLLLPGSVSIARVIIESWPRWLKLSGQLGEFRLDLVGGRNDHVDPTANLIVGTVWFRR